MTELFATGPGGRQKMFKTHSVMVGNSPVYFGYILRNGEKGGIINLSSVVASNPVWTVVDEFIADTKPE